MTEETIDVLLSTVEILAKATADCDQKLLNLIKMLITRVESLERRVHELEAEDTLQ